MPAAADEGALMVMMQEPEPVVQVGLKVAVTPVGSPETDQYTVPLKPLEAVAVAV